MSVLIYTFFCLLPSLMHPLHMSVTNVDIVENQAQITSRIFKDDLALELKQTKQLNINWQDKQDWLKNKHSICKHIEELIYFKVAGTRCKRLGEIELRVLNETIEIGWTVVISDPNQFRVENHLLLSIYPDQKNLMVIRHKGEEVGIAFNHRKQHASINNGKEH